MNNLVKDIKPIGGNSIQYIDSYECIELPVRDAVKSINDMGIKTIMSSANFFDVLKKDEPELDYIGNGEHYTIGNGYAWILIDYSSLGTINMDIINKMNSVEISVEIDDNAKESLINNCKVNGVSIS